MTDYINKKDLDSQWYTGETPAELRRQAVEQTSQMRQMQNELLELMRPHAEFMKTIREKYLAGDEIELTEFKPGEMNAVFAYAVHGEFAMRIALMSELLEGATDGE